MLRGISPILSPDLLATLHHMGHGDELVLGDSNFPGATLARRLLRADGHRVTALLRAMLPLFPLDTYADSLMMMQILPNDHFEPEVEADYLRAIRVTEPGATAPLRLERSAFYERSREAFAVLMTGETRLYGNLIVKKGVIV